MPRVLGDFTVQVGETREFTSAEGFKFTMTNNTVGFKKVRLAFVFKKGRKRKGDAMATKAPEVTPEEKP
jgi:hypothetical protein